MSKLHHAKCQGDDRNGATLCGILVDAYKIEGHIRMGPVDCKRCMSIRLKQLEREFEHKVTKEERLGIIGYDRSRIQSTQNRR